MSGEDKGQAGTRVEAYAIGDTLEGRFRITGRLGRGGFATVYRAVQLNLNQEVAVKVLDHHDDKPEAFVERFLREARTVAQIRHPDVVRVIDFGVTQGGAPYMVMELLEGYSLEDELRRHGAIDPPRALRLMIRALDALQAAHAQGIVHRDLKPANLFLTNIGTVSETLRILDFGIARAVEADTEQLTATGQLLGTPAFLPPEYITHHQISPALDVYQMGLILVQMVTGRSAVGGRSLYQSMLAHVSGELDIPTELLASSLGPVIARSIALHTEDRFKDAAAFRDALTAIDPATLPPGSAFILPGEPTTDIPVIDSDEFISAPGQEERRNNAKVTSRLVQSLARGEVPPELTRDVDIIRPDAPARRSATHAALEPQAAPAAEPSGPPRVLLAAIVVVLLLAGGLGAILVAMGLEPEGEAAPAASAPAPPPASAAAPPASLAAEAAPPASVAAEETPPTATPTRRRGESVARRADPATAPAGSAEAPATAPRKTIGVIDDDAKPKPPKTIGILQ